MPGNEKLLVVLLFRGYHREDRLPTIYAREEPVITEIISGVFTVDHAVAEGKNAIVQAGYESIASGLPIDLVDRFGPL